MDVPKLRILTTGGTFDKIYPTGLWAVDFEFPPLPITAVTDVLTRANVRVGYPVAPALCSPKDSTKILPQERKDIARVCAKVPEQHIVIVHGTDTIVDFEDPEDNYEVKEGTATVIAHHPDDNLRNKTIVLTGASQPAGMKNADADFNLGFAIGAALFALPGVHVAMNGELFSWNRCRKGDSGAFVSKPRLGIGTHRSDQE